MPSPNPNLLTRRYILWIKADGKCHWCGCLTAYSSLPTANQATIDHVIPRWKGGSNDPSNIVLSCRGCNEKRNAADLPPSEYENKKNNEARLHKLKRELQVATKQRDEAIQQIMAHRSTIAEQGRLLEMWRTMTVWEFLKRKWNDHCRPSFRI